MNKKLKQAHKEESELLLNGIIQLKEELVPKLNSIYKECLKNEEPYIQFYKTSFNELTSRHIEFLALIHLGRFLKNPKLVKKDVENILAVPEEVKEYESGLCILLGLGMMRIYGEDY